MKRLAIGVLLLGGIALGGCQSDEDKDLYAAPKPLDQMSKEEWCAFYARYITNPQISPKVKAEDLQRMRQRGCPSAG
jgi:hypothetical protein